MHSLRTSSNAAASTSSPLSNRGALSYRNSCSWRRGTRKAGAPRALPKKGSDGLDRGVSPSTSTSSRLFPLASALALSLAACLGPLSPPPSLAENVRVEDVESPALRAGLEAANEQRWADAERLFRVFLKEEPDSASALSNLANVEMSTGRPGLALEHLDRAVALAPRAAVPRMNRALAKEALAVAAAAASSSSSSSSSSSYERLLASAADDARQASMLDPREFAAFFDLGNILERQVDFEGALEAFERAADLAPGLPGYRLREAASMFQVAVDREEGEGGGKGNGGGEGTRGVTKSAAAASASTAAPSVAKARKLVAGVARKNPRYAEAKAALAAMSWRAGDLSAAEGALDAATSLEGEWRKAGHAGKVTRWPPRLVEAYERFLAIK